MYVQAPMVPLALLCLLLGRCSRELMYQQAIQGFGRFPVLALEPPAPLKDLLHLCLHHHIETARAAEEGPGKRLQGRWGQGRVWRRAVTLDQSEVAAAAQVREAPCVAN